MSISDWVGNARFGYNDQVTPYHSAQDVAALEGAFELDRGVLIPVTQSSARHGLACWRVGGLFFAYLQQSGVMGFALTNNPGFWLAKDPDTVRGPDLALMLGDRATELPEVGFWEGVPEVAVEVVADERLRAAADARAAQFLEAGCPAVWVVDLERLVIAAHHPDGVVEGKTASSRFFPGFTLHLEQLL